MAVVNNEVVGTCGCLVVGQFVGVCRSVYWRGDYLGEIVLKPSGSEFCLLKRSAEMVRRNYLDAELLRLIADKLDELNK